MPAQQCNSAFGRGTGTYIDQVLGIGNKYVVSTHVCARLQSEIKEQSGSSPV